MLFCDLCLTNFCSRGVALWCSQVGRCRSPLLRRDWENTRGYQVGAIRANWEAEGGIISSFECRGRLEKRGEISWGSALEAARDWDQSSHWETDGLRSQSRVAKGQGGSLACQGSGRGREESYIPTWRGGNASKAYRGAIRGMQGLLQRDMGQSPRCCRCPYRLCLEVAWKHLLSPRDSGSPCWCPRIFRATYGYPRCYPFNWTYEGV